ncbi:hypothetical protein CLOM_g2562 [Closterium sp. NIES-68]|nr:hypothetical protein CLOM_g2562 [Closterium sp. NIES-68]GJP74233.1 hypothetical protein CLOP_g4850 [Closterium sp. NIES-67]
MAAAARGADADVDDYMGDLSAFLPPEDATKLRDAQLQQQKKQTKQHKAAPRQRPDDWKRLTWQERRQQVREEKDKAEAAVLAEGLAAPIPPSNIGFKLLQKMGFKGRAEPIGGNNSGELEERGGKEELRSGEKADGRQQRHSESSAKDSSTKESSTKKSRFSWLLNDRLREGSGGESLAEAREEASIEDSRSQPVCTVYERVDPPCAVPQEKFAIARQTQALVKPGELAAPIAATQIKKPIVWIEPVTLSLKRDRKGLGKEEEEEEAKQQEARRAEAAVRMRRSGEEALKRVFEERRKGRWGEWKLRGAFRKARTALLHLEWGDEWLRSKAEEIGAASSSSGAVGGAGGCAAGAAAGAAGGAGAAAGGAGGGGAKSGAGVMERGTGAGRGRERMRRARKRRVVAECDAHDVSDEEWEEVEERREGAREVEGGGAGKEGDEGAEGGEAGEVPLEELVSEELLLLALHRLRHRHFYCIHCGCQYESEEALASMCPGEEEEDH